MLDLERNIGIKPYFQEWLLTGLSHLESMWLDTYRELLGKVLHDARQKGLGGFLRAQQHQVHILIPAQQ